jgi:DNA modification methylase
MEVTGESMGMGVSTSKRTGTGVVPKPFYARDGITIYNCDARELLANFDPACIDFIFTDPPYGHNNNNGDLIHRREAALGRLPSGADTPQGRPIANDGEEANEFIQWSFEQFARLLKPGCCCCCCCGGGGGPDPQFARWSLWMDKHLEFKQMVVWDKGPMGMGWHYRRSYETVLVAMKGGAACRWFDETNRVENIIRHIPKIIPSATDHPTPKPLELAVHFIRLHTKAGDTILDPFCGHGPVLQAARLCGCKAIGIEISQDYCEAAVTQLNQSVLPFGPSFSQGGQP